MPGGNLHCSTLLLVSQARQILVKKGNVKSKHTLTRLQATINVVMGSKGRGTAMNANSLI